MAQINITEDLTENLPDYSGVVGAADAAQNLFEHLHSLAVKHGGHIDIEKHPAMGIHKVTWDGGPPQWANSYAATLAAPRVSVVASSCQTVEFSNLH